MNFDETRKYIHDLANSFSIIDASVTRALTLMKKNHPEAVDELARLQKADEYVKKSILTLKNFREYVHGQIALQKEE
ncbi:MAG: hypothetical protein AB7I27_01450 [Bacteriovoracaceae bacterium]